LAVAYTGSGGRRSEWGRPVREATAEPAVGWGAGA
jgi:hypothetical protein